MKLTAYRAAPTAKARLPFIRPRSHGWRSGQSRLRALAFLGAGLGAACAAAVGWTWRRDAASNSDTGRDQSGVTGLALTSVKSAITGYDQAPEWERSAFNLSTSFAAAIGVSRGVSYWSDQRQGPQALKGARQRHRVHHYLPGIVIAFGAGSAATLVGDGATRCLLALPLGAGAGMTLDEAALLVERDDLYWNNEQLPFLEAALALGGSVALAARFLQRGILHEASVVPVT